MCPICHERPSKCTCTNEEKLEHRISQLESRTKDLENDYDKLKSAILELREETARDLNFSRLT